MTEAPDHPSSTRLLSWLAVLASIFLLYMVSVPWVEAYARNKNPLDDEPVWAQRYAAPLYWVGKYSPRRVQRILDNYQDWCFRKCHVLIY